MYGQMTAGSWIYIGTQGILQGTYETFAECARQHFGGTLAGRLVVTGGLGGMGGAQPLAATMNGAAFLGVDVDEERIRRRVDTGYCDRMEHRPRRRRLQLVEDARARRATRCRSAWSGTSPTVLAGAGPPRRHAWTWSPTRPRPTISAWATSPSGMSLEAAARAPGAGSRRGTKPRCSTRWRRTCARCSTLQGAAARSSFDYGNNLRGQVADRRGMREAFDIPGFVPAFIRPLFCRGAGPFRWVALSGDPADIAVTDEAVLETFPEQGRPGPLDPAGPGEGRTSRACRRGSAGSSTASARRWGASSTGW